MRVVLGGYGLKSEKPANLLALLALLAFLALLACFALVVALRGLSCYCFAPVLCWSCCWWWFFFPSDDCDKKKGQAVGACPLFVGCRLVIRLLYV